MNQNNDNMHDTKSVVISTGDSPREIFVLFVNETQSKYWGKKYALQDRLIWATDIKMWMGWGSIPEGCLTPEETTQPNTKLITIAKKETKSVN